MRFLESDHRLGVFERVGAESGIDSGLRCARAVCPYDGSGYGSWLGICKARPSASGATMGWAGSASRLVEILRSLPGWLVVMVMVMHMTKSVFVFTAIVPELKDEDGVNEGEVGSEIGLEDELVGEDAADEVGEVAEEPVDEEGEGETFARAQSVVFDDLRELGKEPACNRSRA